MEHINQFDNIYLYIGLSAGITVAVIGLIRSTWRSFDFDGN